MEYQRKGEVKNKCPPNLRSASLVVMVLVGLSVIGAVVLLLGEVRGMNRRLSTFENTLEDLKRSRDQDPKISDELSPKKKRSVSSNASQKQSDFEKRLSQTSEKRMNEIKSSDKAKDWRFLSLLRGQDGRDSREGRTGPEGDEGQDGAGVTYVRWGRTTCPSGAQSVYEGFVGGSFYSHAGGGGEYICLPNNPKYDKYKDGSQAGSYIYGTEYQVSSYSPFTNNLHDHDAPCVVCYVKSRATQLMLPARNDCPSGWTEEYHGYLMAGHRSYGHSTSFLCIDGEAESVQGSQANRDGALLYLVEAQCGWLPCPPYVSGGELTCAVCTK